MIGRHSDVCGATFDHLKKGIQHADDGAKRLVLPVVEPSSTMEVAKEFVSAVNQMDNHRKPRRAPDQFAKLDRQLAFSKPLN
jgi:hypothetical protein